MTEAEVLETFAVIGANAIAAFTIYTSFTFAFLATAFFVGSKLTSFQSIVASGLYIVSAGAAGLTQVVYIQLMFAVAKETPTAVDSLYFMDGAFWTWSMSIIQITGIFISLYFMWHIRQTKTE
jgi:hypothetical protein